MLVLSVPLLWGRVGSAQSVHFGVGAFPYVDSTGTGYSFRVWAPNAQSVLVVGDFNHWQFDTPLVRESGGAYWSCDVDGAAAGDEYMFYLNGNRWRKDPRSRVVTDDDNSVLYDPNAYSWSDQSFVPPSKNELVIYELHVGSFNDATPMDISVSTFADAEEKLDYLADLGINCIEVMPVARFPGDRSWGYNPIDLYAVENVYGGADQFKHFVNACHSRGIAVHLDIVHNHYDAANDYCDLWEFDGWYGSGNYGGIYFYQEDGKCCTIWGRRPHFGRQGVIDFITDNVRMWMDEYHVDGFRWDSPMNIKYYDDNSYNAEGHALLRDINQMIRDEYTNHYSIGEDQQLDSNFDSEWYDSFHYNVVGQLTPSGDAERDMWTLRDQIAYDYGHYRVIYTETHDKVGALNNDTRLVSKISPSEPTGYWARKRAALGAVVTMTSPGIPLLFMGQEWFEHEAFDDFDPLDWSHAEENMRGRLLYRQLIHLRRNLTGTSGGLKGTNYGILHVNDDAKVMAWHRYSSGGVGDDVVVVANFSVTTWTGYEVEFPRAGNWYAVFNSDWPLYSTEYAGVGVTSVTVAVAGGKAAVKLAPYSAVLFSQQAPTLPDADQDAVLDAWESAHGLNPADPADALLDPDQDELTNRREFELNTDPQSYTALHQYETMNIPGSHNSWNLGAAGMTLTTHYLWQYCVHLTNQAAFTFKFAGNQSWSSCWGDANQSLFAVPLSGTGDPGGGETPISLQQTLTNATLLFTFCETNLAYSVTSLNFSDNDGDTMNDAWEAFFNLNTNDASDASGDPDGDDFTNLQEYQNGTHPLEETAKLHDYNTMTLVGTFNNWDVTHANMKLFENYGWEIVLPVWTQSTSRFKFAGNLTWDNTWGDNSQEQTILPLNEYGVWQGADIRITSSMNGVYRFRFNQRSTLYSVTNLVFADEDGDLLHDAWETFHALNPHSASDASDDPDLDGFTNLEEYRYATDPHRADPKRSSYGSLCVAGSFNGWSASSNVMTLADNYLWTYILTVTNEGLLNLKFTANGTWSTNWGDNTAGTALPLSGIADPFGSNISFTVENPGDYHIQFNDRTLQYQIRFAPRSNYSVINVPGTFCGWDPTANAMQLVGNYLWQLDAFFSYAGNVSFKFVADESWTNNWGDMDQNTTALPLSGVGDPDSANIAITAVLNGRYRFIFDETTRAYSVHLLTPADHDGDSMPDEWETLYGFDPASAADASSNADGDALCNAGEYIADTDPTDSASVFAFESAVWNSSGELMLNWQGGTGAVQYLLVAVSSNQPQWSVIYTNQPPTASRVSVTNRPSSNPVWFRLKAARPVTE